MPETTNSARKSGKPVTAALIVIGLQKARYEREREREREREARHAVR
jgi:hypothetical protein